MLKDMQVGRESSLTIALAYHALLVVFSLAPPSAPSPIMEAWSIFEHYDFVIHVAGYLLLVLLWYGFLARSSLCVVLAILTGFALEFAQLLVPWRSFSVLDLLANVVGVALAVSLLALFKRSVSWLLPHA